MTFNPQPKPNKDHVKLKGAAYRKFADDVMERDGWCCIIFGSPYNLTVSHRIHRSMGGRNGPGDVLTNADCKCMKCHQAEHY